MQSRRLLSILLRLQTEGRVSAHALAEDFEVSVRTIYRDMDALSAAGVPVHSERGRSGGFQLQGGYRTRLTGLDRPEAASLFLSAAPFAARELGLGAAFETMRMKLLAALPETTARDYEARMQSMQARVRARPAALRALSRLSHAMSEAVVAAGPEDGDGWREVRLPIESIEVAAGELLRLAPDVVALAPRALVAELRRRSGELARLYAEPIEARERKR